MSHKINYVNLVVLAQVALYFLVSFILVFLAVYTVDCALAGKADELGLKPLLRWLGSASA